MGTAAAVLVLFVVYLQSAVSTFAVSNTISSSSPTTTNDIAIVGCGVLGTSLCKQLLSSPDFNSKTVTAITKSRNNHESILDNVGRTVPNFNLVLPEELSKEKRFTNVVFCAPPSGFDDYPGAVADAIENLWAGSDCGGTFVFTSSGGIYGPGNGGVVNELTPLSETALSSPRSLKLVNAEKVATSSNGIVLRLAGLYTLDRGAHNYWLEKGDGTVKGPSKDIINLLHYDDAAGACVAALKATTEEAKGKVFLVSDGNPTTRRGICVSALKSKRYGERSMPTFEGEDDPAAGKVYDGTWSNRVLNWEPRYESFDQFMMEHSE